MTCLNLSYNKIIRAHTIYNTIEPNDLMLSTIVKYVLPHLLRSQLDQTFSHRRYHRKTQATWVRFMLIIIFCTRVCRDPIGVTNVLSETRQKTFIISLYGLAVSAKVRQQVICIMIRVTRRRCYTVYTEVCYAFCHTGKSGVSPHLPVYPP